MVGGRPGIGPVWEAGSQVDPVERSFAMVSTTDAQGNQGHPGRPALQPFDLLTETG